MYAQHYLETLSELLRRLDPEKIHQAIDWLDAACDSGNLVFTCGNGGSALVASQFVGDLLKNASAGKGKRFRAISLSDNQGALLAYANDISYEAVFVEQLKNFGQEGDVLVAFSGSGNSPNILNVIDYAHEIGCRTIGVTTSEGGALKDRAQLPLLIPETHMGRLEDVFFALTHLITFSFIDQ
jgi:D-sedoheptulose 7-phosphate isomerase